MRKIIAKLWWLEAIEPPPVAEAHALCLGLQEVATIWRERRWWYWKTYDGKNTKLAGERGMTKQKAMRAARKWSEQRIRDGL